jgi:hypothetical protein
MDDVRTQEHSTRWSARLGALWRAVSARRSPIEGQLPVPIDTTVPQRHQDALAVLDAARGVVQHGWTQNRWYVLETPGGRRRNFGPMSLTRLDHRQVVEACLVGAVLHAAWRQSPRPEYANPAIDALWHTLYEPAGPAVADPVGPVSSPPVRAARVRDLTTWNDRRNRTRDDVLRLLERSAARIADARPAASAPPGT